MSKPLEQAIARALMATRDEVIAHQRDIQARYPRAWNHGPDGRNDWIDRRLAQGYARILVAHIEEQGGI